MSYHTPAPWIHTALKYGESGALVKRPDGQIIAEAYPIDAGDTQRANAQLIAAAPELLAVLRALTDAAQDSLRDTLDPALATAVQAADVAIAKAVQS